MNDDGKHHTFPAEEFAGYMAIDQYEQTYHIGRNPPRKFLLELSGRQHARKMYVDTKGSRTRHVGYVIAEHWLFIYRVFRWKCPGVDV